MMKEDFSINFSGITHDHAILYNDDNNICGLNDKQQKENKQGDGSCSTIAILRRHPMYDSLVLVKKFRNCLKGYSLEFPSDKLQNDSTEIIHETSDSNYLIHEQQNKNNDNNNQASCCSRRRLVSRFLDGDDPMYQSCSISGTEMSVNDSNESKDNKNIKDINNEQININLSHPFAPQIDDNGDQCELVHVPINGLMDRLKNYTESGIAVDSRVYAFAMGLKTAERILATSSMKELQETPI